MSKDNALGRFRKMQDEITTLQSAAKEHLLADIHANVAELNRLGFSYALVSGRRSQLQRQRNPNRPCPVCKFVTDPPHDARAHRSQGKTKKPFAAAELKELGYSRRS